jgi:hypothetical protein
VSARDSVIGVRVRRRVADIAVLPLPQDLLDYRPTVSRLLEFIWDTKLRPILSFLPKDDTHDRWWRARNLMEGREGTINMLPFGSAFHRVHIPASQLASLTAACKKNSVTLQGLISVACAFATAAVSGEKSSVVLKVGTPFSTRPLLSSKSDSPAPSELIGNLLALHTSWMELKMKGETGKQDPRGDLWSLARSYLSLLQSSHSQDLESIGLASFVDIKQHIKETLEKTERGRSASVLVSNLGAVDRSVFTSSFLSSTPYALLSSSFVQPVHYSAAVFTNNVISCERGGLVNCIAYPKGMVSEKVVSRYAAVLLFVLSSIQESGTCHFQQVVKEFQKD